MNTTNKESQKSKKKKIHTKVHSVLLVSLKQTQEQVSQVS